MHIRALQLLDRVAERLVRRAAALPWDGCPSGTEAHGGTFMSEYALAISDAEVARYRMMAANALLLEAAQLRAAGVVEGAVVADVGCGPAAMSVALAAEVGPSGRVLAVERDAQALDTARALVAKSA